MVPMCKDEPSGFILLELIVVIVIIGVLAALGFGAYSSVIEKVREVEAINVLKTMSENTFADYLGKGWAGVSEETNPIAKYNVPVMPSCSSNAYFCYGRMLTEVNERYFIVAYAAKRCTAGGKEPQGPAKCIVLSRCVSPQMASTIITTYDNGGCSVTSEICDQN